MVKSATGPILAAVVLLVAGLALRTTAGVETRLADAQEALGLGGPQAALEVYDDVTLDGTTLGRLPVAGARVRARVTQARARAAYWLGDYSGLPPVGEEGAASGAPLDLVLLSGNGGFRTVQRTAEEPAEAIRGLDAVLQTYTRVLEAEPDNLDAAFNYEYVALQRILLAAGGEVALGDPDAAEADPSMMQGAEGAPPPDAAPGEFNIIVPMRPDERGEFEAGAGGVRQRQG